LQRASGQLGGPTAREDSSQYIHSDGGYPAAAYSIECPNLNAVRPTLYRNSRPPLMAGILMPAKKKTEEEPKVNVDGMEELAGTRVVAAGRF